MALGRLEAKIIVCKLLQINLEDNSHILANFICLIYIFGMSLMQFLAHLNSKSDLSTIIL